MNKGFRVYNKETGKEVTAEEVFKKAYPDSYQNNGTHDFLMWDNGIFAVLQYYLEIIVARLPDDYEGIMNA